MGARIIVIVKMVEHVLILRLDNVHVKLNMVAIRVNIAHMAISITQIAKVLKIVSFSFSCINKMTFIFKSNNLYFRNCFFLKFHHNFINFQLTGAFQIHAKMGEIVLTVTLDNALAKLDLVVLHVNNVLMDIQIVKVRIRLIE